MNAFGSAPSKAWLLRHCKARGQQHEADAVERLRFRCTLFRPKGRGLHLQEGRTNGDGEAINSAVFI